VSSASPEEATWHCLPFAALSLYQLYALLRLRQEVFAVEQTSIYLDVDGRDQEALHLFATQGDEIVACCRILAPGVKYDEPSIGRVCTAAQHRGRGLGLALLHRAIARCQQHYPGRGIRISAQLYLREFYAGLGFAQTSQVYDEDGILHIEMQRL
jgi:ElaA protein